MRPIIAAPGVFTPPKGFKELDARYGKFTFTEMSGGNVNVDDTWEKDNIVTLRNVSGTKLNIQLHRLVAPIFEFCLTEAMKRVPGYKVRMLGGYCPRHQMHNPKYPLSTHSWGCAFDINWDKNPVSKTLVTDIPESFREAFVEQGFEWGGAWKGTKDAMHFQFANGV